VTTLYIETSIVSYLRHLYRGNCQLLTWGALTHSVQYAPMGHAEDWLTSDRVGS